MIKIVEGKLEEYGNIASFFVKHGLEFSENAPIPTTVVNIWKAVEEEKLVGAIVLAVREGKYIVDGLAVENDCRGAGVGKKLYEVLENKVKEKNGEHIFLVARIPEFWDKAGFEAVDKKEAPNFFECLTCAQFEKTCYPKVMKKRMNIDK